MELPGLFEKRVNMMENHIIDKSKVVYARTLFLATRKAWEARRHARTQTAMKLSVASADVSGKAVTK